MIQFTQKTSGMIEMTRVGPWSSHECISCIYLSFDIWRVFPFFYSQGLGGTNRKRIFARQTNHFCVTSLGADRYTHQCHKQPQNIVDGIISSRISKIICRLVGEATPPYGWIYCSLKGELQSLLHLYAYTTIPPTRAILSLIKYCCCCFCASLLFLNINFNSQ